MSVQHKDWYTSTDVGVRIESSNGPVVTTDEVAVEITGTLAHKSFKSLTDALEEKVDVGAAVTSVVYDLTNKKIVAYKESTPTDVVTVAKIKDDLNLAKSDVGLGNVDNTSDANKPISTATLAALNAKVAQTEFDGHVNDTDNPHQVTAALVGLGNVDNTADADKDVNSAVKDGDGNVITETYETKAEAVASHSLLQGNIDLLSQIALNLTGLEGTNFGGFSLDAVEATAVSNIATIYTNAGYTTGDLYWFLAGTDMSALKAYRYDGSGSPVAISSTVYDFTDFSGLSDKVLDYKGTITTLTALDALNTAASAGIYYIKTSLFNGIVLVESFYDGLATTVSQLLIGSGTPVSSGGAYTVEKGLTLARRTYSGSAWSEWSNPIASMQSQIDQLGPKIGEGVEQTLIIESGTISGGANSASNTRLRTNGYIQYSRIRIEVSTGKCFVWGFKEDNSYVNSSSWITESSDISYDGCVKYRLVFAKSNDATIAVSDFSSLGVKVYGFDESKKTVVLISDIINDTTTGGTNVPASAESVKTTWQKALDIEDSLKDIELLEYTRKKGLISSSANEFWALDDYYCTFCPIPEGAESLIVETDKASSYAFVTKVPTTAPETPSYATGYSSPNALNIGKTALSIPSDAKYLYVLLQSETNVRTVSISAYFGDKIDKMQAAIEGESSQREQADANLDASIKAVGDRISDVRNVDLTVNRIKGVITPQQIYYWMDSYRGVYVPLDGVQSATITSGNGGTVYVMTTEKKTTSAQSGQTITYATGAQRVSMTEGQTAEIASIPSDAQYLFVLVADASGNETGAIVKLNYGDKFSSFEKQLGATNSVKKISRIVTVASSTASDEEKAAADYVCDGTNDEAEIQAAIDDCGQIGTVKLGIGTFNIGSFPAYGNLGRQAIKVRHVDVIGRFSISIEGVSNRAGGTVLNVVDTAFDGVDVNEQPAVIGCPEAYGYSGLNIKNIRMMLPFNTRKVVGIDLHNIGHGILEFITISIVDGNNAQTRATAVEGCVGIRAFHGSDTGFMQMFRHCYCGAMYEGFQLGAEHHILMNCGGRFNHYCFTFGNYNYREGTNDHPICLINCMDEMSLCLPKFVRCGWFEDDENHPDNTLARQSVNFYAFNFEAANSAVTKMEEVNPGAFCGHIEFTDGGMGQNGRYVSVWKSGSGLGFDTVNLTHHKGGTTSERATYYAQYMQQYYDTDLHKLLTCVDRDNQTWVDANGNIVLHNLSPLKSKIFEKIC